MSGDPPTHWLDCPDCSCRVFARFVDLFGDGESEHCKSCGSLVTISTDEESPVDVRVYEHGGDVVARFLEEIEHLQTRPAQGVSDGLRARVAEACEVDIDSGDGCVAKGCIPGHQAGDLLDAFDDSRAEVAQLTHVRDALVEEYLDEDDDNEALVTAHREHWERCVIDERRPAVARLVDFVRGRTSHYSVARMATMAEDGVELLEREVGTLKSTVGDLETRLLAGEMTVAALEQERVDAAHMKGVYDSDRRTQFERAETAEGEHRTNMDRTPEFENAIFSDYAFVGWVWTITHHHEEIDAGSCPPEFMWLGDTGARGWAMDAALRKGWSMLGEDALAFATANLLPLCKPWLRDYLLGILQTRTATPPLGLVPG